MLWDFLVLIPDWNVIRTILRNGNIFRKNKNDKNDQYDCCWLTRAQQILIHFSFFSGWRYALPVVEAVKRIKLSFLLKNPLKRQKLNICSREGKLVTSTALRQPFSVQWYIIFTNMNPAIWDSDGSYQEEKEDSNIPNFFLIFMMSTSSYTDMSTSFYFCTVKSLQTHRYDFKERFLRMETF